MIFALMIAVAVPQQAAPNQAPSPPSRPFTTAAATPNPRAVEFVERDPAVRAWALARYDANHDGWLTTFEAEAAREAFRDIADANRDGRLTVSEYDGGVAFVRTRY